jgi:hypothetical protein
MRQREIADEIIHMAEADQRMRKSGDWDDSLDQKNTERLKEIVKENGWPTRSKVGKDASFYSWLLVQHADHDVAFQKACLDMMKREKDGEVDKNGIAYLEDRVRVNEEKPILYGTQFYRNQAGEMICRPIEDSKNLDSRRKSMGLEPFAEYEKYMRDTYGKHNFTK